MPFARASWMSSCAPRVLESFWRAARCACLLLLLVLPARAAQLTWNAPAGCPDRDAIRWRVEEALGTTLEKAADLNFTAKAERHSENQWLVRLAVQNEANSGNAQQRTLEAKTCDELAQAVSVAIALALGADNTEPVAATPGAPADSTKGKAPESRSPVTSSPRAVTPENSQPVSAGPSHPLWYGVAVGPSLDRGSLPSWALGIDGAITLGTGAISGRLGGLAFPSVRSGSSDEAGGKFSLFAAALAFCGNAPRRPLTVTLCGGAELGRLSGEGVNVNLARSRTGTWVAPRIDLELLTPLGSESVRLFGRGTLATPLIRKEFVFADGAVVHQPNAVIGRLSAGLELLWP